MARLRGVHQRGTHVVVRRTDIRLRLNQRINTYSMPPVCGPREWCHPVLVTLIDIDASSEKYLDARQVAIHRSKNQNRRGKTAHLNGARSLFQKRPEASRSISGDFSLRIQTFLTKNFQRRRQRSLFCLLSAARNRRGSELIRIINALNFEALILAQLLYLHNIANAPGKNLCLVISSACSFKVKFLSGIETPRTASAFRIQIREFHLGIHMVLSRGHLEPGSCMRFVFRHSSDPFTAALPENELSVLASLAGSSVEASQRPLRVALLFVIHTHIVQFLFRSSFENLETLLRLKRAQGHSAGALRTLCSWLDALRRG
mmetsp:Transcript_10151/g.25438  ORF Transcript_10151/g.25438 Transcript_10151/m.25438 type:complete len:317 (+) Transcript_10151:633-1583(+)